MDLTLPSTGALHAQGVLGDSADDDAFDARLTLDDPVETAVYAALVRQAVQTLKPARVLDVGCGLGEPTIVAARAGATHVTGIDIERRNVLLAREAVRRAALERQVKVHHTSWADVVRGRVTIEDMELVAANPPYVPYGVGPAVDGGPTGTRLLGSIIQNLPHETRGLSLLFGSISNPLGVLQGVTKRGFEVVDVLAQSVPFGRYTSHPRTLGALRRLRRCGLSWFSDVETMAGHASHAYLVMGLIARRSPNAAKPNELVETIVRRTLSDYQTFGPAVLRRSGFVSILRGLRQ